MSGFEERVAKRHHDDRGFFQELGRGDFRQINWSHSYEGTLRGLHYATYPKLVTVIKGQIWDVAVDCRPDSSDFGKWNGVMLDQGSTHQVYIPANFAHGFFAMQESDVVYAVGREFHDDEITLHYADPKIKIAWPFQNVALRKQMRHISKKDSAGLRWDDFVWLLRDLSALKQ